MDYISVLLGLISVIQGYKKAKTDADRIAHFRKICEMVEELDGVLIYAKRTHDSLDTFMASASDQINSFNEWDQLTVGQINDLGKKYVGYLSKCIHSLPELTFSMKGDINEALKDFPANLIEDLEGVFYICPQITIGIRQAKELFHDLETMMHDGKQTDVLFRRHIASLQDGVLPATLTHADKVILFSAKIMAHLHHNISQAIKA